MKLRKQIEEAAAVLAGKKLWRCTRAADLACFQFGDRLPSRTYKGELCEVGEYALHIQCSWRIVREERVIVARRDLYYPAAYRNDHQEIPEDFRWDVQGANRQDRLVSEFFADGKRSYAVERIAAEDAGALRIVLENKLSLEIFPDDSLPGEHWRLFKPDRGEPHFVVTGAGIKD